MVTSTGLRWCISASIKFHMLGDSATWVSASTTFNIFYLLVRLVKKAHLLRCASIVSLQRTTKSTPPLADFSRASQLKLFDQPAIEFVQESFLRYKAQIDQLLHR